MPKGVVLDRAALVPKICERLATGEPLSVICRDLGISRRTVNAWRESDPEIAEVIQEAKDDGYDAIAADCVAIADDGSRDYTVGMDGVLVDHDHIQRSKLRVETRLKLLAKWDPKRYGDRQQLEHTGPGGGPVQYETHKLTDDEIEARIAALAAKATVG